MPPQAFGEDMDVPFISWVPRRVQLGTDAIAPPGALMLTPKAPSVLGPLEDQVYWLGGSFSLREYSATIMSGVTYAPTPEEKREQDLKQRVRDTIRLRLRRSAVQWGCFNRKFEFSFHPYVPRVHTNDTAGGSPWAADRGETRTVVSCA